MSWIRMWWEGRFATAAPSQAATQRFDERLNRDTPSTIYVTGCSTYQLDEKGRPFLWPDTPSAYRELIREPVLGDFDMR